MKRFLLLLPFLFLSAHAAVRTVPAQYATIQSAINASVNGDTVLVAPGTYLENINYRGKNIVVTSRFYENNDVSFIYSTVINGGKPSHPDTASVVLFINHEDSSAVLQGFTITGGKGTAWPDEHSPGTFTEGGGILAALSSPRIVNNFIINNEAVFIRNGIVSGGGGGIRVGDGNPYIANNIVMNNRGRYGAGIVVNYSGAVIRNNIIVGNTGGGDFGGGGVWLNGTGPKPKFLENNTIVGNQSLSDGGGLLLMDPTAGAVVRNNILWGNTALSGTQISLREGAVIASTYNDIQGWTGGGTNIALPPMFADSMFILSSGSPLVDAGDTSSFYNDKNTAGTALFPSRGTKRNDIGAYGGAFASVLPLISSPKLVASHGQINFGKIRPDSAVSFVVRLTNIGTAPVRLDSIRLARNLSNNLTLSRTSSFTVPLASMDSIALQWNPHASQNLQDTLLLYHNDTSMSRPFRLLLSGKAFSIDPAVKGTMYAGSGTVDSAKLYTLDTSLAAAHAVGVTGFSQIISMRTNPKTGELIALVNSATPQLMRISASSAESFPLPQLVMTNPKGMVFRSDGTLLIGTFSGTVFSVNMSTGAVTSVGSNGLRIAGLAFNPVNGSLWMSVRPPSTGRDNIYKLNPATMAATLVGATGFGISTKDITFDDQGRLFGVLDTTGGQSYLVRIDTATAKGTIVGGLTVKGIETIDLRSSVITSVLRQAESVPEGFALSQNFPNPFNPTTTFQFRVEGAGSGQQVTTVKVYTMLGQEIATLFNGYAQPGALYQVNFNASQFASGMYLVRLSSGSRTAVRKIQLLK
jgi:hypothetical protein